MKTTIKKISFEKFKKAGEVIYNKVKYKYFNEKGIDLIDYTETTAYNPFVLVRFSDGKSFYILIDKLNEGLK